MTHSPMVEDKIFCINCQVMRHKSEWRQIPVKGRKAPVKRCMVCLRKKALRTAELKKVSSCS